MLNPLSQLSGVAVRLTTRMFSGLPYNLDCGLLIAVLYLNLFHAWCASVIDRLCCMAPLRDCMFLSLFSQAWLCTQNQHVRVPTSNSVQANGSGRPPSSTPLPPTSSKRNPFDDSSNATARRLPQAGWGGASASTSSRASSESGRVLASARSASSLGH